MNHPCMHDIYMYVRIPLVHAYSPTLCVYVCMYVCTWTSAFIYVQVCVHCFHSVLFHMVYICVYLCTCVCMRIQHVYTCAYIHTYVFVYIYPAYYAHAFSRQATVFQKTYCMHTNTYLCHPAAERRLEYMGLLYRLGRPVRNIRK
jgi:hypothetical protein